MQKTEEPQEKDRLQTGDIITVEYEGVEQMGFVYQDQLGFGVITENGTDLGTLDGKRWTLKKIHRNTGFIYDGQNHEQVQRDFQAGKFTDHFKIH